MCNLSVVQNCYLFYVLVRLLHRVLFVFCAVQLEISYLIAFGIVNLLTY